jgi:hypothetical protein
LNCQTEDGRRKPETEAKSNFRLPTDDFRLSKLHSSTASFSQPALAKPASFVFGVTAPDPGLLVRFEGVLQTLVLDRTSRADNFGCLDLVDRGPRAANGKEQRWFRIPTCSKVSPFRCDGECGGCHAIFLVKFFTRLFKPYEAACGFARCTVMTRSQFCNRILTTKTGLALQKSQGLIGQ